MREEDFLREVLRHTGCGLLLDLNNAHVACLVHQPRPRRARPSAGAAAGGRGGGAPGRLRARPRRRRRLLLIDSHGSTVDEAVWRLFAELVATIGPVPTLIERDHDVPSLAAPLATPLAEAAQAQRIAALGGTPAGAALATVAA